MLILYAKPAYRPFRVIKSRLDNAIALNLARQLVGSECCWMVPGTFDCDGNSTL